MDESYDVLEAHHVKNCHPKAPNPERLNDIRTSDMQANGAPDPPSDDDNDSMASQSDDSDGSKDAPHRAARHSKTPYGSKLPNFTQLQAYPPIWRDLLEDAKRINRSGSSNHGTFDKRKKGLQEAEDALAEAMATFKTTRKSVEKGTCSITTSFHSLTARIYNRLLSEVQGRNESAGECLTANKATP